MDICCICLDTCTHTNTCTNIRVTCCGGSFHDSCLFVVGYSGYVKCPLCRDNLQVSDYFTLSGIYDMYIHDKIYQNHENNKLDTILWECSNTWFEYIYYKTSIIIWKYKTGNLYVHQDQPNQDQPDQPNQDQYLYLTPFYVYTVIIGFYILVFLYILYRHG